MLQYILLGLALGSIYAIAAAGIVVTFVSAGVLNLAFGSMAYVVARFYYLLNSQHGWASTYAGSYPSASSGRSWASCSTSSCSSSSGARPRW
jgi:branched-subunit amino acid ABC-type transport system permease component